METIRQLNTFIINLKAFSEWQLQQQHGQTRLPDTAADGLRHFTAVDLLPAQQRVHGENWYRGTADAVTQNLDIISRYKAEYVVILAGDHIYKQDYSRMLIDHVEKGARCTVACMPVPIEEASAFGVMAVDENEKIIEFVEKPANPPAMPTDPTKSLASMGIYVFDAAYLYELLEEDDRNENSSHDFGKDIIPKIAEAGMAYAHPFPLSCVQSDPNAEPYWRDVGTLESGKGCA